MPISNHTIVQELINLINLLREEDSLEMVIAGGCARDLLHNRVPKDYDVIMLTSMFSDELVQFINKVIVKLDKGKLSNSKVKDLRIELIADNYGADQTSNLAWVIKVMLNNTIEVDFITFNSAPETPKEACEAFDCTLNMAWIDQEGQIHKHEQYPKMGDMIKILDLCDRSEERIKYLGEKFPQYQWPVIKMSDSLLTVSA